MFHPLPLFVGLRYVRARSHKFFVSFITWASLVGVCVGVAALIVILSVMNGFEGELRDRLLSLSAHARVVAAAGDVRLSPTDWRNAERIVRSAGGVEGVARYAEIQSLAVRTPEMLPVLLRGIEPQAEGSVTEVARSITQGHLSDLKPGSDRIIVGEVIAERLGLAPGDTLTLLMVFAHLEDVRALAPGGESAQGLRVRFHDALAAPALAARLRALLPHGLDIIDWTQDNANYFRAIRIEKTMMSLILLLIVAVAAFNIVAMLVMVVTDKRTDIAILRTFGASPRRVMGIFITQGLVIGWLGVALGIALGLTLALHVDTLVPLLEQTFGFQIMDADVYYITSIPSDVQWANVVTIAAAALLLTAIATVYPAIRAARTAPAEALRYE